MHVILGPSFRKQYRKLPAPIRQKFDERLELFAVEPFHPLLNNHALHGERTGHRSINITSSYRATFKMAKPDAAQFTAIGTHHELYGA